MLKDKNAIANIAVHDLNRARKFYQGILGLNLVEDVPGDVLIFKSGNSSISVYQSEFAGTNQATAMTWSVEDDVEKVVGELKSKGISFEHYDMPEMKQEGDIYVGRGMKVAWFKDPDGNILNIAGK